MYIVCVLLRETVHLSVPETPGYDGVINIKNRLLIYS